MNQYQAQLSDLMALLNLPCVDDVTVSSLSIDSRLVESGGLFFAYPGHSSDGRQYLLQAQQAGAAAIIYEADGFALPPEIVVPAIGVHDLQGKVGLLASAFYGQPSADIQVFGVTGTNGKTTCCYLLTQAFSALGLQAAMIGTIGVGQLSGLSSASHTTPDPVSLHRLLAEFRDAGITQVCMEVSSHALDQGRVAGTQFYCVLFSNLSHDHLDYHGNMVAYGDAKRRLFTEFTSELAVINVADEFGRRLCDEASAEFVVGFGQGGDVYADDVALSAEGLQFVIEGNGVDFEVVTPLIGSINVPNLEMLVACLLSLSTPLDGIQRILAELKPAPGRMELFSANGKPRVVVDYAHTPDALDKALRSITPHCEGALWCVFGCGGDRDRAKRPVMGKAAEAYASHVVITNDNPRSEDPQRIANEIALGVEGAHTVILDRADAIEYAVTHADESDWVLVAGKGHESTQTIGQHVLGFSDREFVATLMGVAQ
ncbi:UDP-N-acetylmuramoyl-L-alanyl-D-glutamate--2,6-diaminopimelate ligase [Arenicella chitinivorans]|uniref:UDP-N-acetylmuramoyl-L-alanyl-D-glutamate--2,6-diaminopimelate ligase n=1 Tax=Arenicella chitinivorans TaxID=1329800 RepID=A0A918RQX9_9GAMM|nr:UDP-N-acetylmuramoyl-L-alanyl-D-glutamate--2,6-diaminopimelate ligase [Arenicella chitinivorans]GHA05836.1 UDP-N-acetylmuramoyl-L-alanyl-D-glutamate--2,6-diaminopimelate ligase [Arenicella chitinivorans]